MVKRQRSRADGSKQPRAGGAALAIAIAVTAACNGAPPNAPGPSASASGSTGALAAPSASADVGRGTDALWERARTSGDASDLAALAGAEGAVGLSRALGDATRAETARAALPLAADRALALEPLATRMAAAGPDASACGEALLAVLSDPGPIGERLDPEADARAVAALLALAADRSRDAALRALAISALRRLAERGLVAPGRIPGDLDE